MDIEKIKAFNNLCSSAKNGNIEAIQDLVKFYTRSREIDGNSSLAREAARVLAENELVTNNKEFDKQVCVNVDSDKTISKYREDFLLKNMLLLASEGDGDSIENLVKVFKSNRNIGTLIIESKLDKNSNVEYYKEESNAAKPYTKILRNYFEKFENGNIGSSLFTIHDYRVLYKRKNRRKDIFFDYPPAGYTTKNIIAKGLALAYQSHKTSHNHKMFIQDLDDPLISYLIEELQNEKLMERARNLDEKEIANFVKLIHIYSKYGSLPISDNQFPEVMSELLTHPSINKSSKEKILSLLDNIVLIKTKTWLEESTGWKRVGFDYYGEPIYKETTFYLIAWEYHPLTYLEYLNIYGKKDLKKIKKLISTT